MTDATRALELDRMLARDAIRDVLARYARGIDRADAALLKSCYFDDAIEEHGSSFTRPGARLCRCGHSEGAKAWA